MTNYKNLFNYTYFESNDECYYISNLNIIIDKNKNILMESNINLFSENYLNLSKSVVSKLDLSENTYYSIDNVICIQHWFSTYGHFKDEIFNLYNFYKLFGKDNYKVLMNYKPSPIIGYTFDNYNKIQKMLFNSNNFINAIELQLSNHIIKCNNIILIKHVISSPMFHIFPALSINKILSHIENTNNNDEINTNVFITRGTALHMPRNLKNQEELETYFLSINYSVINPEIMDITLFIKNIKNAKNVYITWGGAMVNLCYVNSNSNIYLLQSLSYKGEDIFSIFKFLKNYKNLYIIKCTDDNIIDLKFENKIKLNT